QLFARLDARRCLKDVEPRLFPEHGGPDHGDVVELHGPAGTVKTELLYHLLCRCVMPAAAGGLEVEVMFVDTDYSLDMLRLVSILDRRLTPPNAPLAGDLFVVAAGPGAPPHRQHLCFLLVGPQRGRGQHRQAGGETQQVFASAGPPAQVLLVRGFFRTFGGFLGGLSSHHPSWLPGVCFSSVLTSIRPLVSRDYRITVFATCHAIRRNHAGPSASSELTPLRTQQIPLLLSGHRSGPAEDRLCPESEWNHGTSQPSPAPDQEPSEDHNFGSDLLVPEPDPSSDPALCGSQEASDPAPFLQPSSLDLSPVPMESGCDPAAVSMETEGVGSSPTEQSPTFSPLASPCLRLDDEDSLSPLFHQTGSEDCGGSGPAVLVHSTKFLKQCAFCYRGDSQAPLGQGHLMVFGPTPGYCAAWSEGVCCGEGQSLLYVDKAIDWGSTQVCFSALVVPTHSLP
ncbi:unnamed protein product, partial [Tetraodon nigroviridis]